MGANQIDSEQAFSGVAQTANIGSSTSVSSGAAKIFREFKWGLLTLFILMTVVVCLVYDGGRGKKKTDVSAVKPTTSQDAAPTAEILPTSGSDVSSSGSPAAVTPLMNPERPTARADDSRDPWHSDATPNSPLHHLGDAGGNGHLPDLANDGSPTPQNSDDKPVRKGKGSHARSVAQESGDGHEGPVRTAERETKASEKAAERDAASKAVDGAFKWYVVKPGDNITRIANANLPGKGGNKAILEANKDTLPDANRLREGMKIRIPNSISTAAETPKSGSNKLENAKQNVASGEHKGSEKVLTSEDYVVQSGDTLERIARKVLNDSHKWKELLDWNKDRLADATKLRVGMVLRTHGSSQSATPAGIEETHTRKNTVRAEAETKAPLPNNPQNTQLAEDGQIPFQPIAANATSPAHKTDSKKSGKAEAADDDQIIHGVILP